MVRGNHVATRAALQKSGRMVDRFVKVLLLVATDRRPDVDDATNFGRLAARGCIHYAFSLRVRIRLRLAQTPSYPNSPQEDIAELERAARKKVLQLNLEVI